MVSDWDTFQVKITKKEREIIDDYKKSHKIKADSKLFRMAMEDILEISIADSTKTPPLPIEFTTVRGFWQKYRKELASDPKNQELFDIFFNEWAGKFLGKWLPKNKLELEKANEKWDSFKKHEKVGRPKNPKKKRGGQKDTWI